MKEIGAIYSGEGNCRFTVWAPLKKRMQLQLIHPHNNRLEMQKEDAQYFSIVLKDVIPGTKYLFIPEDGDAFPDPASFSQPEGVHGPSEVFDHSAFKWTDENWQMPDLKEMVIYELHVGTFTEMGTFDAIIPRIGDLYSTGIRAIQLMPVIQFPGSRNWGYDGVYPYAVQNSYGGPDELKKLVDACHKNGIAVFLDVVYNHLGPEGNYFQEFGPYFSDKYKTPWGKAINFDEDWSDGVRDYFSGNALYWFEQFHIDGLRCDAIHMVYDNGAVHFWEYMNAQVKQLEMKLGRSFYLIAESDLNSPKVTRETDRGGYGFNAQWLDDFHHALYTVLDVKGKARYEDFGSLEQLAKGYTDGFILSGQWVKFRKRHYGASSAGVPGDKFIVFNQNHDQVGNRPKSERLHQLIDFERVKLAAAAVILSPYIPLLFMGEEYADESPFNYFISHSDAGLIKAVQEGRKNEFATFNSGIDAADPQDEKTFNDSKLNWEKRQTGKHAILLLWHRTLIALRKEYSAFQTFIKSEISVEVFGGKSLVLHRTESMICIFNFVDEVFYFELPVDQYWEKILDSKEERWNENAVSDDAPVSGKIKGGSILTIPGPCAVVFKGDNLDAEKNLQQENVNSEN